MKIRELPQQRIQTPKKERHVKVTRKTVLALLLLVLITAGLISFVWSRIPSVADSDQATISVLGATSVNAGQKLTLPIIIDTKGKNINAAEVYLSFNPRILRVDEITKNGSFFTIWIGDMPKYSNEDGTISFAGGLPKPGFTGKGQLGTITVTLLKDESATLTFTPKTRVLLNDGKASAIPLSIEPIPVTIK